MGVKLDISLPDTTSMTFWVHPLLVQYRFNIEVNLQSLKSILDSNSTLSNEN